MVELTDRDTIFAAPKHPYTSALLSAVPRPDPRNRSKRITLMGEVANPAAPPSGCYFHPRCQFAIDKCKTESPVWEENSPGHWVRCHRANELELPGIDVSELPVQWSADGHALYLIPRSGGLPLPITRYDLRTGKRRGLRKLGIADPTGVPKMGGAIVSRDARAFVMSYIRTLGDLYLVAGVR